MKSRQRGLSLIGTIFMALLLAGALLVGFRMIGPYKEYFALQRIIGLVADEGNNGASDSEMRQSYDRRAIIDSIEEIKGRDLVISKENGQVVVEIEYERKAPLFGNVSLSFDFTVSSKKNRK